MPINGMQTNQKEMKKALFVCVLLSAFLFGLFSASIGIQGEALDISILENRVTLMDRCVASLLTLLCFIVRWVANTWLNDPKRLVAAPSIQLCTVSKKCARQKFSSADARRSFIAHLKNLSAAKSRESGGSIRQP